MLMSAAFLFSALVQFALALLVAALVGPREYGLYALVLAAGILVQAFLLDGLRLTATRLHHRGEETGLRRRLERAYARLGLLLALAALGIALLPIERAFTWALAPLATLINGFAEFRLALLRAEFEQKRFTRFMVLRNLFALVATPLAAHFYNNADAALLAFLIATLAAMLIEEIRFPAAAPASAPPLPKAEILAYAGPIVATNGFYLAFFYALRAGVAAFGSLAAAGVFSLALDFVLKLFSTFGTALDLALFPLALKAEREQGMAAALAQARANLERVIATLAPMALGLALVAPGLEPLLVTPAYRGAFAPFVIALLPGVLLYAVALYALHPFGQLERRTGTLALAAAVAMAVGAIAGFALRGLDAPVAVGLSVTLAMLGAVLVLGVSLGRIVLPSVRFAVSLVACLALIGVAVTPLVALGLDRLTLALAVFLGALAYGAGAYALDLAGVRALLKR